MALILCLDTATEIASIVLGNHEQILATRVNTSQKDHAAFVQIAVQAILEETGIKGANLDAIAVSAGPGSYTGLRVGLASAKGLCFSWQKPLILLNTLEVMAKQAIWQAKGVAMLYCPMIDARRREVFAALYNRDLEPLMGPGAYVLDEPAFKAKMEDQNQEILFFGSGSEKWQEMNAKNSYNFTSFKENNAQALNQLAQESFSLKRFADVAYSEPLYFKSFYTTAKVKPGN